MNKKSPSVKIVNGIVNTIKTGLIKAFSKVNTVAVTNAVMKSLTCTPGTRYEAMITASQVKNSFIKNFIFYKI